MVIVEAGACIHRMAHQKQCAKTRYVIAQQRRDRIGWDVPLKRRLGRVVALHDLPILAFVGSPLRGHVQRAGFVPQRVFDHVQQVGPITFRIAEQTRFGLSSGATQSTPTRPTKPIQFLRAWRCLGRNRAVVAD